uniref:Putative ovule protein n=1 Tax=Solanum chacoense TaxID=4108 RepID=A0A0V0GEX6_SOLCH
MKKVTLSSVSHSARRSGCTLVVNLKPTFSFIKTTPAGTEAMIGETILHIPYLEASGVIFWR